MILPELSAAITSVKAIKDSAKFLADVSKNFEQVELKLKIVELVGQITDLSSELQELKQKLTARDSVSYASGVYWRLGEEGNGDPYCPRCLEAGDKLIHMHEHERVANVLHGGFFYWGCISCKKKVIRKDKPMTPKVSVRGQIVR